MSMARSLRVNLPEKVRVGSSVALCDRRGQQTSVTHGPATTAGIYVEAGHLSNESISDGTLNGLSVWTRSTCPGTPNSTLKMKGSYGE